MTAVIRLPWLAGENIPIMANTEKKWRDFTKWQIILCPWCIQNVIFRYNRSACKQFIAPITSSHSSDILNCI